MSKIDEGRPFREGVGAKGQGATPCTLGFNSAAEVEELFSLQNRLSQFSEGPRMPIMGFEETINSLLKKLDQKKGGVVSE